MGEFRRDGRDCDRELPATVISRGARQGEQQGKDLLAGVLTGQAPRVVPQGLDLPAIGAEIRRRRTDSISLPVLS